MFSQSSDPQKLPGNHRMSCVPTEPNAPDKSIPADLGCPSPTLSLCQYFQRINRKQIQEDQR
jgi:hypothetical protein